MLGYDIISNDNDHQLNRISLVSPFLLYISLCRIIDQLGSGQFGEVCKAQWTVGGHTLDLAVKTLKSGVSEVDKVKFLQEAAIMDQFNHSNIIKMYGVITLGEPVSVLSLITIIDLKGSDVFYELLFCYLFFYLENM